MPKVSDCAPPPHQKYVVKRRDHWYTATPCYGMHRPWWVVRLMPQTWPNEAEPVDMNDDDEWWPLDKFAAAEREGEP